MAAPGHYPDLRSNHPLLELTKAISQHDCLGVAIERGERPERMRDAWMVGHSKRCCRFIRKGEYYLANSAIPDFLHPFFFQGGWRTCMPCGIEFYGEYIEGERKVEYLRPISPEMRRSIVAGAVRILAETVVPPTSTAKEAA